MARFYMLPARAGVNRLKPGAISPTASMLPARAGVNRWIQQLGAVAYHAPRASGGEPLAGTSRPARASCSPRERG